MSRTAAPAPGNPRVRVLQTGEKSFRVWIDETELEAEAAKAIVKRLLKDLADDPEDVAKYFQGPNSF